MKNHSKAIYIETISFSSTERLTIAPESCVAIVKYTVIDHFEECVPFQLFRIFFFLINLKSSSYIGACIELLVRFHEPWFFW